MDKKDVVDYIPTIFVYTKTVDMLKQAQKEKRVQGFDISHDLAIYGARLEISAFTRGKKQLSLQEVEYSKKLLKVCIHVECVIGLLKNNYTILQSTLPVSLVKHKHDSEHANINRLLTVYAALVNVCPSVVPKINYFCKIV